jgi:hypothetical protein
MRASDDPGAPADRETAALGGALETLFGASPANDVVTLPEAEARLFEPEGLPELREPGVDVLHLGLGGDVEPIREAMPELLPLLREVFDLGVDLCDGHVV